MTDAHHDAAAAAAREYAALLTAELVSAFGNQLTAAYLHGSAALGGWVAARSDVDILFVVGDDIRAATLSAAGELLIQRAAACPGRGLECSVVTEGQAATPAPPWPFLLHVGSRDGERVLVSGETRAGDPDLLMHYVVCRAAGISLAGARPEAVIGDIDRPVILEYLANELDWGLQNAPESYAVLNACRARLYLNEARIVSKLDAGLAALDCGVGPPDLVRRALDQQLGRAWERPTGRDGDLFVRETSSLLRAAVSSRRGVSAPPAHGEAVANRPPGDN